MLYCLAFSTVLASIPEAVGKLDEECSFALVMLYLTAPR